MLAQPPVPGDPQKVAGVDWEFKNKWVLAHFEGDAWRSIRWRNNLDAGTFATPPAFYAKATETVGSPDFLRPGENGLFDLVGKSLPLGGIERRTGFYDAYLFVAKCDRDSARRAAARKIERVGIIGSPLVLAGASDAFIQKQPQFV